MGSRCQSTGKGYTGGFFAYVLLAIMAIGVSIYFWVLDRKTAR